VLALDGAEWSALRPDRFNPRERAPGDHWLEAGWATRRSGRGGKEKNSQPLPGLKPLV